MSLFPLSLYFRLCCLDFSLLLLRYVFTSHSPSHSFNCQSIHLSINESFLFSIFACLSICISLDFPFSIFLCNTFAFFRRFFSVSTSSFLLHPSLMRRAGSIIGTHRELHSRISPAGIFCSSNSGEVENAVLSLGVD